jgi:hypothetical protein
MQNIANYFWDAGRPNMRSLVQNVFLYYAYLDDENYM